MILIIIIISVGIFIFGQRFRTSLVPRLTSSAWWRQGGEQQPFRHSCDDPFTLQRRRHRRSTRDDNLFSALSSRLFAAFTPVYSIIIIIIVADATVQGTWPTCTSKLISSLFQYTQPHAFPPRDAWRRPECVGRRPDDVNGFQSMPSGAAAEGHWCRSRADRHSDARKKSPSDLTRSASERVRAYMRACVWVNTVLNKQSH